MGVSQGYPGRVLVSPVWFSDLLGGQTTKNKKSTKCR